MRLPWPLTGRSEELRLIKTAISDPDVSGIIVCGAAGVGKSRIAREALSSAVDKGCHVRWAVGTSLARALPLGAFEPWVDSAGADSLEAVRGVIRSLTSASPGARVVVGVDDVHLLDDLSAFVLRQIGQRRAAHLVLTVRDGEPVPAEIRDVWKDGQFERLDLQPLSRGETATLVSTTLGGSVDPDVTTRLWKLTRGNVLYLRNIVDQEVVDGRLARRHGVWQWTGEPVVSPGLVELIESRFGALPTPISDVLDALAVGEPLDLTMLTRITDRAAVEDADARGLITLEPADDSVEVRVAHPLYGEVRRRRAVATRLRRMRALVAGELAAADDADDIRVVVRRAILSLDSDLQPDPDLLLKAAHGAVWLADMPLAERLAHAAIRAGAGVEAYIVRGHALSWLSRGEEADAVVAEIPASELTEDARGMLTVLRASNMLWALGNPTGAKALIDEASRSSSPQLRSWIDVFHTIYWHAMGKPQAAAQASKNVALDRLPTIIGAETAWAIACTSAAAGRSSDALAAIDAGYDVATRRLDAPQMRFIIADAHVDTLLLSGRIGDAVQVAQRLRLQAEDLPGLAQLISTAIAGRAALGAGRLHLANSLLDPVAQAMSASGESNGWAYRYQLSWTVALALRGSTREAVDALAALEHLRHPSWQFIDYELAIARGWVSACQGGVSEAIETILSMAETAHDNGQFAAEVMCLQAAAQLGDRFRGPRLHELEVIVEGPRVGVAARFADALHAGDGAELAAVSGEFEQMGDLVAAVDAAAHAAMAYLREGLRGSALGCSARAEALAEQCGGASTPALRQASERLPLTSREREIVMLLGEGLSSPAIAKRLTLSARTIEGHIYRAMAKTGAASRDELAAVLPRQRRSRSSEGRG